ncbi:MAG: ATP-dependent DNA ligase [Candidatus Alkanophagales archaeon MCA70_species_1]|nr:ATP-dependent DNA ligase [Candidatus Alkanophaga volatiphilum]
MWYSELVEVYEKIEATTKRLEMTEYLVELFKKTPSALIDKVVYLTQGRLYPEFVGIELGLAEKLALRALANAAGIPLKSVEGEAKKVGDVGLAAENILKRKKQATLFSGRLDVETVYSTLDKIARTTGEGSVDIKIKLLSGLLADATPKEAKYLMRTVTGRLRLGVADMTILDALAVAFADKEQRELVERAYNITSDLGYVAKLLAEEGLEGLKRCKITVGRPIRMMLAQRLTSAKEVLEKLGGRAACEFKYDGERIQLHKKGDEILLFSRRLENITMQYPDVVEAARRCILAEEAIVEGECVAVDPDTGDFLPFQELMHRRRKYGIERAVKEFPASFFLFDALYDGEDLTQKPYPERRRRLEAMVKEEESFRLSEMITSDDVNEIERFFELAIENGCEGLMLKSVAEDSIYQAGARGWLWIKLKRSYQSKMIEPIDVVVVGAFMGKGRRAGTYGALLVAVYDDDRDIFPTICKLGSGFSDKDLEDLPKILEPHKIEHKHPRVESSMEADVWFAPAVVLEIIGDELTLSPIHTCAFNKIREGAGIAVRFPRFTGRFREDKAPEDATTVKEIIEMYQAQLKKID